MKRILCCLLTMLLVVGSSIPLCASEISGRSGEVSGGDGEVSGGDGEVSGGDGEVSGGDGEVSGGDQEETGPAITLRALNVAMASINDQSHEMTADYVDVTVRLTEDKKLPDNIAGKAPKMEGWEFVGCYTAPVKYAFWGDFTNTPYTDSAPLPFDTDCDGHEYNFKADKSEYPSVTLTSYWRWLSTLAEEGHAVKAGDRLEDGEDTLYALYRPTSIEYQLDYCGWGGRSGVMSCERQYGTPFGNNNMTVWEGYEFDGWYPENDKENKMEFYDIPAAGVRYVAHWHKTDGSVTWENYQETGYKDVTSVVMKDGNKDLGDTLKLYACSGVSKTIYVTVSPSDSGVTKLDWKENDPDDVVKVEVLDNGLRAVLSPTGKAGTAVVTVASANGKSDSVTVDTTDHAWDKSTVTQWGNCIKPTKILYECVYCHKTKVEDSLSKHQFAYRDVAATCTTPHIWEHYCKVCGYVDADENKVISQAEGHRFETTVVASCGGTVTTRTCTVCGFTQTSNDNWGVHNWSSVSTVDVRPTCHSNGSQSIKCQDCGVIKDGSSTEIPADTSLHNWGNWVVDKEATETTEGQKSRTCLICGQKEFRAVPPTTFEVDTSNITGNVTMSGSDEVADQAQADEVLKETMDNLLGSKNGGMLADDILNATIQEKKISTEVRVTPVAVPNSADAGLFNVVLGNSTVLYMDIDILVMADNMNIGRITETDSAMTFNVALPGSGRIVRVIRAHEGTVESIPCWVEGSTVYFTTDKFSTFAVSVSNDISLAEAEPIDDQSYTGSAITPGVKVTVNGGETLREGVDYTLIYRNNVEIGTATVVIDGMGDFAGTTKEVTFRIVKSGNDAADSSYENNASPSESAPAENVSDTAWGRNVDVDWNKAMTSLKTAAVGSNVNVSAGTGFIIPVAAQAEVLQDNVTLACQITGTDVTITLSAGDIKNVKEDIGISISNRAENIPAGVMSEVTAEALSSRVLNIGEKRFFSQKLNVHMIMGAKYAGRLAVMYSYDEITGRMKYEGSFRITSQGQAVFQLLRGDEYVVVVTDSPVKAPAGNAAVMAEDTYRVVSGDTVSKIASRCGVSINALLNANPQIKNANRIYPGGVIVIPGK